MNLIDILDLERLTAKAIEAAILNVGAGHQNVGARLVSPGAQQPLRVPCGETGETSLAPTLQTPCPKLRTAAIEALPGPTEIRSGDRAIAVLCPARRPVPKSRPDVDPVREGRLARLSDALAMAEKLAIGRDASADDAALAEFGDVDPINWNAEAVRALKAKR